MVCSYFTVAWKHHLSSVVGIMFKTNENATSSWKRVTNSVDCTSLRSLKSCDICDWSFWTLHLELSWWMMTEWLHSVVSFTSQDFLGGALDQYAQTVTIEHHRKFQLPSSDYTVKLRLKFYFQDKFSSNGLNLIVQKKKSNTSCAISFLNVLSQTDAIVRTDY